MLKLISRISIILFAVAGVPIADIIWNSNALNPFYLKEMMVTSLIISSIYFLWLAIIELD